MAKIKTKRANIVGSEKINPLRDVIMDALLTGAKAKPIGSMHVVYDIDNNHMPLDLAIQLNSFPDVIVEDYYVKRWFKVDNLDSHIDEEIKSVFLPAHDDINFAPGGTMIGDTDETTDESEVAIGTPDSDGAIEDGDLRDPNLKWGDVIAEDHRFQIGDTYYPEIGHVLTGNPQGLTLEEYLMLRDKVEMLSEDEILALKHAQYEVDDPDLPMSEEEILESDEATYGSSDVDETEYTVV